jgi:hypothetical protein
MKETMQKMVTSGRDGHPSTDAFVAWVLIMDNSLTM